MDLIHEQSSVHSQTTQSPDEWNLGDQVVLSMERWERCLMALQEIGSHCVTTLFLLYFYFEHLNFTRSYLIDMKISWSFDHIDLILTILSRRSTILSWSLDLIIRWWSKIRFFYFITYMHLTCLWLMSFIDDWHAFYTCCCTTCFYHMFYMCLPWGQHMDISI